MDRSTPIKLISVSYTVDSIGQRIETETEKTVFCELQSVSRSEWQAAGEMGLNPEFRAVMFAPDYSGELIAEINGKRYGIYRTYIGKNEMIDLYMEHKVGNG